MEDTHPSVDEEVVKPAEASTEASAKSGQAKLPRWLRRLQNESWQAEMIISGSAVFALFSTYDLMSVVGTYMLYSTEIPYNTFIVWVNLTMGVMAFVLIVGFVVHLVLRGFWIGLIGLNYVYPDGIVQDRLKFAGKFASSFRNASNNEFILRLDRYCSTIFALTFLSLFSLAGLIIYFMVLVMLPVFFIPEMDSKWIARALIIFVFVFMLVGLITLLDFVLGGRIKRIRWFSSIYYPLYRIVSVVTLSFVYRRLYYTLVSNMGGFRVAPLLAAPLALLITIGFIFGDTGTGLSDSMFPATAGYSSSEAFLSIEKEVVENSVLEIFITHPVRLEDPAFEQWKVAHPEAKEKDFSDLTREKQMDIIQQLYRVKVDGKRVADSTEWFVTKTKPDNEFMPLHRIVLRKSVDLAGLANGSHELTIRIELDSLKVRSYLINKEGGNHARIRFLLQRK